MAIIGNIPYFQTNPHRERTCKVNGQHKSTCLYPENVQEEVETADFGEEACRDIVASWLGVI